MRFPAINGQKRQRVSIPKLNGGVNYRDALNLVEDNQLTDVRNMWFKDGALRTRHGFKVNTDDGEPFTEFTGILRGHCYCQSSGNTFFCEISRTGFLETKIHAFDVDGYYIGFATITDSCSFIVPWGNVENGSLQEAVAYTMSGKIYGIHVQDNLVKLQEVSPYIPSVLMSGKGTEATGSESVGGDLVEGYNLLTEYFYAYYNTDEKSTKYYLPTDIHDNVSVKYKQGEDEYIWSCVVGGDPVTAEGTDITVEAYSNMIKFSSPLPAVEGRSNNLKVTARAVKSFESENIISSMKLFSWFGGSRSGIDGGTRLFVAGDVDYPNRIYFSGLNNPLYFSDNSHIEVGSADSKITAFGKQSDMLVIFKTDETYFSTYSQGESINAEKVMEMSVIGVETAQVVFPITQLSGNIGCDLPQTIRLMQNRLVWADSYGRVWTLVYSNEYSTRNIRAVGGLINRKLKDKNLNNAMAVTYDNYYILVVGDEGKNAFVLDTEDYGYYHYTSYGSDKKAQNSMGWYRWELPDIPFSFSDERAGAPVIFSKTSDKLIAYTLGDGADMVMDENGEINEQSISCMFQTKVFDMRYPEKPKHFDRVNISVGKEQELAANVTYITENRDYIDSAKISCEGISDEFTVQYIDTVTLSPNLRCKRFSLRVENDGAMYIDGIVIYYKM